jgi:hypothetical protein
MLVTSYVQTGRVLVQLLCNFFLESQVAYFSSNEKDEIFSCTIMITNRFHLSYGIDPQRMGSNRFGNHSFHLSYGIDPQGMGCNRFCNPILWHHFA